MAAPAQSQYFLKAQREGRVVVDGLPMLDLKPYITNYKGRTRFERLYLIGTSCPSLSLEALHAAIAEAKGGKDILRFESAVSALRDISPADQLGSGDPAWVDRMKKQVKTETDRMEQELKGYKNNLIRESIRMGHDDLGQHYHNIGDLAKASKIYASMRESCTTNAHVAMLHMHLINVSIEMRAWFQAQNYINRLRQYLGGTSIPDVEKHSAKLSAAYGLCSMAQGNYAEAAKEFVKTNPRMSQAKMDDPNDDEAYNEVLTPNDIAVYGGLCAMASMDRDELRDNVLNSSDFRNYLELEPHIRRAISALVSGRYSECLKELDKYKSDYLLDIYLQPHLPQIYYDIRGRAIHEETIALEVTQMIKSGVLEARIDLVGSVIRTRKLDPRAKVHADALAKAKEYERTLTLRIFKMAVSNAGLEVKSPKDKGNQGGGGGDGGMSQAGFGYGALADLIGGGERSMRSGRGLG
ncbi:COP9 signalosome complex subunit 1, partial [Lecanoromycetidae sp. Uapishka_2]